MTKQLNEENIRVAAYFLWENAGRPEGKEKEFWHQACNQLLGLNNVKNVSKKSSSKSVSAKSSAKKAPVKAAVKKMSALKPVLNKVAVKPAISKISVKPAVIAKPFYGVKK